METGKEKYLWRDKMNSMYNINESFRIARKEYNQVYKDFLYINDYYDKIYGSDFVDLFYI